MCQLLKLSLSNASLLAVSNVGRNGNPDILIQYQCTASNKVENPVIAVANVTVYCNVEDNQIF